MIEPPVEPDEEGWASLNLGVCPRCGSARLVPAVEGWDAERYCLKCHELVGAEASPPPA